MAQQRADILLAVRNYPPQAGGTAFLLYDILKHFPPDSLVAVSGSPRNQKASGQELPFPNRQVLVLGSRFLTPRVAQWLPAAYIRSITRQICAVARQRGVKRIYAHYPNAHFTIAAYHAAERLGLPLTVYFDILWEERGDQVELARRFEHRVVQRADQRFAITEYAVAFLSSKHGVPFELIPHTIDADRLAAQVHPVPVQRPRRVHFAGGIYPRMNRDAVLRMARVINRMPEDVVFDVYTATPPETLRAAGMPMERTQVGFSPREEMPRIQQTSDVLYLPQAFESDAPDMIHYNFPTKALEYMAAGRPILVHSPRGAYLTEMAREHGFGLVVDTPDEAALEAALRRLLEDEALQRELVAGAYRFARSRDGRHWASAFYRKLMET